MISIDHRGRVAVDGIEVSADLQRLGQLNLYSILIDNTSYELAIEQNRRKGDYSISLSGANYQVQIEEEHSRSRASSSCTSRDSLNEISVKAPIPGLVVSVPVEAGRSVAEGETLVVLEAMKMENVLRAPRAGIISSVNVEAGAQVTMGQVLIVFQ